jgi:hypothetical protein
MSFNLDTSRDTEQQHFEQMRELINYIEERLAVWNNFEVEQGAVQITLTISKPPQENTIGIQVNDQAQSSDHLR